MDTIMIRIDAFGRSPLEHKRHRTGCYGTKLQQGQEYTLWHQPQDAQGREQRVRLIELFSHIHTGPAGSSTYVYAEFEVLEHRKAGA